MRVEIKTRAVALRAQFAGISMFLAVAAVAPVNAQEQAMGGTTTAPADSLWTRSYLTGDWWGARSHLANHGVTLDLRYTSTYQGLESGTGKENYRYGGKMDAFINLDSGKMGLWEGGGFRSHLEYSHGDARTNLGGAIFAVNTAQFWPKDSFGLGAYRYNLSDQLQDTLFPNTSFKDESAIEVFYSCAVTPWLFVGGDVQYINPAAGSFENALVLALRIQIRF